MYVYTYTYVRTYVYTFLQKNFQTDKKVANGYQQCIMLAYEMSLYIAQLYIAIWLKNYICTILIAQALYVYLVISSSYKA